MSQEDTPDGIVCPQCGLGGLTGQSWSVVRTEIEPGAVVRERKCLGCKRRIQTKERLFAIIKPQERKPLIHVSAADTDIQNRIKNAKKTINRNFEGDGPAR